MDTFRTFQEDLASGRPAKKPVSSNLLKQRAKDNEKALKSGFMKMPDYVKKKFNEEEEMKPHKMYKGDKVVVAKNKAEHDKLNKQGYTHDDPKTKKVEEAYPNKPTVPEFGNQIFGGDKGIIVKQIKRLVNVIEELGELKKNGSVDKETMAIILSQLDQIGNFLKDTPVEEAYKKMLESLYNLNKQDPMDSEILIQGLGRMTLQQAIKRVKEYADEISAVASKDPWTHQSKLTHHIDMLGHYNKAVQDAYKDLAKIRKQGGTRSRGIDPDLNEIENYDVVEGIIKPITEEEFDEASGKKDACYHKVKSRYKVWPSAYASGALVQCRKKGAKNWGNKSKK